MWLKKGGFTVWHASLRAVVGNPQSAVFQIIHQVRPLLFQVVQRLSQGPLRRSGSLTMVCAGMISGVRTISLPISTMVPLHSGHTSSSHSRRAPPAWRETLRNTVQGIFVFLMPCMGSHNSNVLFLRLGLCKYLCFVKQKVKLFHGGFIDLLGGRTELFMPGKAQSFHENIHTAFKLGYSFALNL